MKQVLVVDDSAVIRKVARRILEGLIFRTSETPDGRVALAECERMMPDVILLDWNMPEMDGFNFCARCAKCRVAEPKVVFCTTENEVGHIARAMHAGADEYIMKPFITYRAFEISGNRPGLRRV